jgi:hypothetical protein
VTAKLTEKPRKSLLPHPARRPVGVARAEARFAAPPMARFVPAKAVGSFVPTLTKKAFEKFGFSTATLITDWARIAGAELAQYTMPDKLKWPRGGEAVGADEDEGGRRGATLILRVDPARALDVEYRARQIMDRINVYFGYRAVETIRLVQAPLLPPPLKAGGNPERLPSGTPSPLTPSHKGEGNAHDDPLLAALARLERGVRRHGAQRSA